MDLALAGRVAIVTGGTSGIGLASVRAFLAEGADVAFCGRNGERLANAAQGFASEYGPDRILAHACDVTMPQDVADFATAVTGWRGRADILVNNAGEGRVSTFGTTTDEQWRAELDLKFFSQVYPIRAFGVHLRGAGRRAESPEIACNRTRSGNPGELRRARSDRIRSVGPPLRGAPRQVADA